MPGREFGRYRVVRKIGAGGMGEVYHAHDTQLDRDVALKLLPSSLIPPVNAHERLLVEARSGSALNHPNICAVYDEGEIDGQVYIAMEYIEGQQLADVIPPGGLASDIVIAYGLQLADALAHAHDHRVIHGDLKTSNVLVTPDARVKLLDFGLAKRTSMYESTETTESTVTPIHRGKSGCTPAYAAPEVLAGSVADVRSDVWSFGVVLYEMAAGRRPFRGRTGSELTSEILHMSTPPLPGHTTSGLQSIVKRCLEKNSARRYGHVNEIRAALEAVQPISASDENIPIHNDWRRHLSMRWIIPVCAALLSLLALMWLSIGNRPLDRSGRSIRSLAVLPFRNLSGNSEQEYFADGMTDQLITELGTISALRVVSRTSVMRFKDTHQEIPSIAKELQVDAVVQGSILRSSDRVRITVQLTEAKTDENVWAQSYERDLRDVVKLQGDVATAIARQIRTKLTPREQAQLAIADTTNAEAYQAYLRARFFWNQRSPDGFQKALALFLKAIEEDPSYAQAYCGLADTYILLGDYGLLSPTEAYPLAKGAAIKAIQLNDDSAEAHTSLAGILQTYDRDWVTAEREYKRALELNANYVTAHQWYGTLLTVLGRHDESISQERQAVEIAPLSARVAIDLGYALFHARRYDEAIEQGQKGLELDTRIASGYELLGRAYLSKNLGNEAVRQYRTAVILTQDSITDQALLAYSYAKTSKETQAFRILHKLEALPDVSAPYYHIAMIYVALKDYANAMAVVEQASRWQRDKWPQYLAVEEAFDPIRSEPRFQAVLRKLHFSP